MENADIQYRFVSISCCNMCSGSLLEQRVMGRRLNKSQGKFPRKKIGITTTICRCTTCGLIYSNPMPVPLNIQQHYGVVPEEYWQGEYFKHSDLYFQKEMDILKTLMVIKPGMNALDIGAGIGKTMIAMERNGFDSYGLEASETFYKKAIELNNIAPERLKMSMLETANYKEEAFNFISFGAVLEHLYDPNKCITQAMKWLAPGGIMHIEVPSSKWLVSKIINSFYRLTFSGFVCNISPMHTPFHLYEFKAESFIAHSYMHGGYRLIKHDYEVPNETYLPKFMNWIIKPIMRRTDTGMQLTVWLQKTN